MHGHYRLISWIRMYNLSEPRPFRMEISYDFLPGNLHHIKWERIKIEAFFKADKYAK